MMCLTKIYIPKSFIGYMSHVKHTFKLRGKWSKKFFRYHTLKQHLANRFLIYFQSYRNKYLLDHQTLSLKVNENKNIYFKTHDSKNMVHVFNKLHITNNLSTRQLQINILDRDLMSILSCLCT